MPALFLYLKLWWKFLLGIADGYRRSAHAGINRYEQRVYSQHREDGIIDWLLQQINNPTRRFVEFGFGPDQSNCLRLALHRNYEGVFLDGDEKKVALAKTIYRWRTGKRVGVKHVFLDRENLNQSIFNAGTTGNIDVLSIDVDGNDFWFWQCLHVVNPAIVVIEYNASLGIDRAISIPYTPNFVRYRMHKSGFYHGASLPALEILGTRMGYRLVACDSTGVNAFFVRHDIAADTIPGQSSTQVFFPHRGRTRYKKLSTEEQFALIDDLPYINIDEQNALSP